MSGSELNSEESSSVSREEANVVEEEGENKEGSPLKEDDSKDSDEKKESPAENVVDSSKDNVEDSCKENVEKMKESPEENVEDNSKENVEDNSKENIEDNSKENVEDNSKKNVEKKNESPEENVEKKNESPEENVEDNSKKNESPEENVEDNSKKNVEKKNESPEENVKINVEKKNESPEENVKINVKKKNESPEENVSENGGEAESEVVVLSSKVIKPLTDKDWFSKLSEEEISWYKENGPSSSYFEYKTIQCTGCSNQILNTGQDQVFRHPFLGVAICRSCKNYYENGEWSKDEEGYDVYCRWCGNGGDLLLCDFCTHSFCKRCIQRNLGRRKLHEISKADKWKCLLCSPALIYYQRSMYHAFVQFTSEKSWSKRKSLKKKEPSTTSRDNFLDDNIGEAFKTLSIYQKWLEDERRKWIKSKKRMDTDAAGAIARNLRKIYAITKQNMDLLDADLVQSFFGQFPDVSSNSLDVSRGSQKKRKRETAPPSPVSSQPDEFIVNGSPVTAEYFGPEVDEEFDPSTLLQVEFRETLTPSKKSSQSSFNKSNSNNDSDIEVLTLDSDDEPPPPQPKKRKPGPKSKTMYLD